MKSIKEVSEQVESDLQQYLESTYHLHHPRLLKERRAVMADQEISTEAWVEASPAYVSGNRLRDLNLPTPMVDLLKNLEQYDLDIFDPPYKHQATALQKFFNDEKDLIVSTGTGSGKTEIFLYSILGQLTQEAQRQETNTQRGIRTLVLYPMNALVADQLARMRLLFGDKNGADTIEEHVGHRVQFGMYTGRTPYHGQFDTKKNDQRVKPILDRYLELERANSDLYKKLKDKGRIPAKDLAGYRNKNAPKETHFRTQPNDRELFTRQEMHADRNEHGGTPDILITNYSMLEYMLLRPIEQPLFEDTQEWLDADEENELLIVLDEAHLYSGAQGAEVALLLSRLLQNLGITRDRVRFILTSATMGDNVETAAPEFAAQLTTGSPEEFAVVTGDSEQFSGGKNAGTDVAEALESIGYTLDKPAIRSLADLRDWDLPDEVGGSLREHLAKPLEEDPLFRKAHEYLREDPQPLPDLAQHLFPDVESDLAHDAAGNLLYLSTEAERDDGRALLPTRLHMFLKGLPSQYVCVNPDCEGRRVEETDEENKLLGRMYTTPQTTCEHCGSRVFELLSHRTCGAAYIKAYRRSGDRHNPTFLWTDPESTTDLDELHLLVEEPRDDPDPDHEHHRSLSETTPSRYLDITTGHLVGSRSVDPDDPRYIEVWVPADEPEDDDLAWSWTRCPGCGIKERRNQLGETKISDLETKGEEPFANVVRSMFQIQPEDEDKDKFPNKGKKILCFSDGRQKAARLARDLQGNVELDSFREVITDIVTELPDDVGMDRLFAEFSVYCKQHNIVFFDDHDEVINQDGIQYQGSRNHFQEIQNYLETLKERYGLDSIEDIPEHPACQDELSNRPEQYDTILLRSLGDPYFSILASLIGYLRPLPGMMAEIKSQHPSIDEDLLEAIIVESLRHACEERAFDPNIDSYRRNESKEYGYTSPSEQGLTYQELVPEYLRETLSDTLSESDWDQLRQSFVQGRQLFKAITPGQYAVNPAATKLQLELESDWYRCHGCHRFSAVSLDGACPHDGCNGTLEELAEDDIHLEARKDYLRDPPRRVARGERDPFTLRSEEHTAQLNAKDHSEPFAKSEKYELLFQDILVGESEADQPIDVLSCTTTMEVGIDIGSLTGIAMRTVPPGPENYEQRSGRAGRRGVGLSTILTFADNSPHESYYFEHPEKMIGEEGGEPIIYAENEKIAQRHINASLLAQFFDPAEISEDNAAVFESLGTGSEFFTGDGTHTFERFKTWLDTEIFTADSETVEQVGALLPDSLGEDRTAGWRGEFIRETAENFRADLENLNASSTWETETEQEDNLLSVLIDDALLPTFSFPTDVCNFMVKGIDPKTEQPKTQYEMSRDLKQALSTYVPGRDIVVDKKTFTSYGVYYRFAEHPVNRAAGEEWNNLNWLNFCRECDTVYDEVDENLEAQDQECSVCGQEEIKSQRKLTPPAFAPEVDQSGRPEEGEEWAEQRVSATPPKYPLTPTSQEERDADPMADVKEYGDSEVGRMTNEQLLVANLGPDDDGFDVCTQCGAVSRSGDLGNNHNRPYPKDIRRLQEYDWEDTCSGDTRRVSFSHEFPSDLTLFRIPIRAPMRFEPEADWFTAAAQSLSEALVMGASRAIEIDRSELEGGFRTRSSDITSAPDIKGYLELFLFDTTPGGAGFSSRAWERFDTVLQESRHILKDCTCANACHDCLRAYENRHLHGQLNRHYGEVLLEYALSGTPPALEQDKATNLVETLEQTLQLQTPDVAIDPVDVDNRLWELSANGTQITVGVRSCLRDLRFEGSGQVDLSDYQLTQQLPETAHRLTERL